MKFIDERLEDYAISKSNVPSSDCDDLEIYTKENETLHRMLIGKLEASFLGFLIRSHRVHNILEIGTYTGYSALAMAEHLPEDGKVITLDINSKTAEIAKSFWNKSTNGHKITQILGRANETIETLDQKFGLVFIDADKPGYIDYLKLTLDKLTDNGIIVIDNVLWSGRVVEDPENNKSTEHIKAVNDFIKGREDLYGTLLPVRDGMFLVQKI